MSRVWINTTPKQKSLQKDKPWRSNKYLSYIRTLDCVATGRPAEVAHHIIGCGMGGVMGDKIDDSLTIPLTQEMHLELHNNPNAWETKYGKQQYFCLKTIAQAIRDSQLKPFDLWVDGIQED